MRLLIALCIVGAQAGPVALEPDFDLVSFTPKDGTLSGRQALTAVFTLAVIPLGADLGDGPLPEEYVPFVVQGVEVPGRLRWVSTSTARFDPSVDWPSDLKDVAVKFNAQLTSVSGKSLRNAPKMRHFSTAPLTYWVREVRSKTMEKLTDGSWSASLEEERFKPKNAQECPFDAQILVDFNFPVVVERFVKDPSMFQLVEGGIFSQSTSVASVSPCPEEAPKALHLELGEPAVVNQSRCVAVTLPKTLETETAYVLSLRKGARYHPFAGAFAGGDDSEKIRLTGLRPFRFNFLKRHYGREFFKIYLRHGLKDQALAGLQGAMSITGPEGKTLGHELRLLSNSTLQMQVHGLRPETQYAIKVAADPSVLDGMGLPLQASAGLLEMTNLPGVFLTPQPPNPSLYSATVADRFLAHDLPEVFPLLQRRLPKRMISKRMDPEARMQAFVCSIASTDELGDFLTFFFSPLKGDTSVPGPCTKRSYQAHPGVLLVAGETEVQFNEVPLHFPSSRLLFLEFSCVGNGLGAHCPTERPANRARFLNGPSFTALTAFSPASDERRRAVILVAVHDMDQQPMENLQVDVWEIPSTRWMNGRSIQPQAQKLRSEFTDAHGRALFELPKEPMVGRRREEKGYIAMVTNPKTGEILLGDLLRLTSATPVYSSQSAAFAASLHLYVTTDRAVYAPGDALALVGLVASSRCSTPGEVCSPQDDGEAVIVGEFIWRLERPGHEEVCSLHFWPVSAMGMFMANLTVPPNASIGKIPAVSLYWASSLLEVWQSCAEWRQTERNAVSIQNTPFLDLTIADPRPPTAVLGLGAPHFLVPGDGLRVNATLETYTGIPLQNQELEVELSYKPARHGSPSLRPMMDRRLAEASSRTKKLLRKTDVKGRWSEELDVAGELSLVPKLGDELNLKVSARGPTGEILSKSRSLPLRIGPWDIHFRTSVDGHRADGPLPGHNFTVWTTLEAKYAEEGWSLGEKAARISLVPAEDADSHKSCEEWLRQEPGRSSELCLRDIDGQSRAACEFRLPVGRYAVVAKIDMRDGQRQEHSVSSCSFVGRSARAWRQKPLASPKVFRRFEVRALAASHVPGDNVRIQVWNPLPGSRMLVIWGIRPAVVEVANVSAHHTVDLGLLKEEDCPESLCKVHLFMWSSDEAVIQGVPTSVHYPKGASLWAHEEMDLQVQRPGQTLKVRLHAKSEVVKPGADVEIEVLLEQSVDSQTELALLVVDKAWLDLQPLKLQEPTEAFQSEKPAAGWRLSSSLDGLASATSLAEATERLRRSFDENPWMGYIGWPLALRGSDDSILDDEHYINKWAEELTHFPPMAFGGVFREGLMFKSSRSAPMMEMAPMALMAAPVAAADEAVEMDAAAAAPEAGGEEQAAAAGMALRKRFAKLVALNRALLEVGSSTWKTRIRLPEDLSTYVVRVVAVSQQGGHWSWGRAETSVTTAQPVYGKPLLPRMLRFADVSRMGVAVEAVSAGRRLLVEVVEHKNLRLLEEARQSITMQGTSQEVRFTFAADQAVGSGTLIFRIQDQEGNTLDLVQATVEVERQQQGLRLASTTSIKAVEKEVLRKEAVAPLKVVPGTGLMSLSASVGMQAPLLNALLELGPTDQPWQPQGDSLLAILLGGLILQRGYGMEATHRGLSTAMAAAEGRLAGQVVLDPFLGFVNTPPEHRWQGGSDPQPDLLSNAMALLALRAVSVFGAVPASWAPLDRDALAGAAYKAIQLRRKDWERCCSNDMSFGRFLGHSSLATFFLALPDAKRRSELAPLWAETLREAQNDASELALLTKLASGVLGPGMVMSFPSEPKELGGVLLDRIRVQGPTAYFAESSESMHAATTWVQALALWLWAGTDYAQHPLAPLVASHILSGERCPWQRHLPPRHVFLAALALFAFDTATGSSAADLPLQVLVPGKTLLQAHLTAVKSMVATAWPWTELPSMETGMALEIHARGRGLAVVSYGMDFVPMMPLMEPQFRGILVQKLVQKVGASSCGAPLTSASPGETLCVTVQITSPDDLQEVEVVDWLPAGLEPMDEPVSEDTEGGFFPGVFLSWEREVRHDAVVWRTSFLWAGTHSLSYHCLANAPGIYSMPAAKAVSAKHPEVMGLSGASAFLVEESAQSANAVSGPQFTQFRKEVWANLKVEVGEGSFTTPKACPEACPAAGSCNVAKGICECASSSGQMLPCHEVSVQVQAPFSKLLGPRKEAQEFVRPQDRETDVAVMPSSNLVFVALFLALVAAGSYYLAKTKMPRNLNEPGLELGTEPFTASDTGMRRRERREEGGLVAAEAAE